MKENPRTETLSVTSSGEWTAPLAVPRPDLEIQVEFVALRASPLRLPGRQRRIARPFGLAFEEWRLRVGQSGRMRTH